MDIKLILFVFILYIVVVINGNLIRRQPIRRNRHLVPPPTIPLRSTDSIVINYFDQYLDHFTPTDTTKWKQQYFENNAYYKPGGPIFIYIGGEAPASIGWMTGGDWIENAKYFNALCFQLEHRYYGSSQPKENLSVENMKYLTSEQALADLAYFIESMNNIYNLTKENNTKWVAFGGSYPGNLASWLRYKYPHLVHAAVASSGPVYAKADYHEYLEVVANSLVFFNPQCIEPIRQATQKMEELIKDPIGRKEIEKLFKTCEGDLNTDNDLSILFQTLSQDFAGIVQYNTNGTSYDIEELCNIMTNATYGNPIDRYAFVHQWINNIKPDECIETNYQNLIDYVKVEDIDYHYEGVRQWIYQTCSEFGFYQTSNQQDPIWGSNFPLNIYIQECQDIYGESFNGDLLNSVITNSNRMFGSRDIQATRVVYVHGSLDPWHILGLYNYSTPDAPAIFIEGASHCQDMVDVTDLDSQELTDARKQIRQYLEQWLNMK